MVSNPESKIVCPQICNFFSKGRRTGNRHPFFFFSQTHYNFFFFNFWLLIYKIFMIIYFVHLIIILYINIPIWYIYIYRYIPVYEWVQFTISFQQKSVIFQSNSLNRITNVSRKRPGTHAFVQADCGPEQKVKYDFKPGCEPGPIHIL